MKMKEVHIDHTEMHINQIEMHINQTEMHIDNSDINISKDKIHRNLEEIHLNRLSEIGSNKGIRFSQAAAHPGCHCPMHTALATIKSIKGVSSLVVGMPECGYYSRYVMDQPLGKDGELHYVYVLDSNEVIFGCREGLMEALQVMVQEGAKAIVVIMTCIPALIGEDIQEITEVVSRENDVKAVCIDMAHYKRNGYEAGYYEIYESIYPLLQKGERVQEQVEIQVKDEVQERNVNIFGPFLGAEAKELIELFVVNNYKMIRLATGSSLRELENIITAKLTIVTTIHALSLAKLLYAEYQIPYVFLSGSYSLEDIAKKYQSIFEILEIEVKIEEWKWYESTKNLLREAKHKLSGRNFVITSVFSDVLSITAFLSTLLMNPLLLHVEEYNEGMEDWKAEILRYNKDPFVTYLVSKENISEPIKCAYELSEEEIMKPLITFGRFPTEIPCCFVNEKELNMLNHFLGFERTSHLITCILHSLEEYENAAI